MLHAPHCLHAVNGHASSAACQLLRPKQVHDLELLVALHRRADADRNAIHLLPGLFATYVYTITMHGRRLLSADCRHALCGFDTHTSDGCCLLSLPLLSLQPFCWLCHDSTQHAWLVVSPCCCLLSNNGGPIPVYLCLMLEWHTGCLACAYTARYEWQHKFCSAFNTCVHLGLQQLSLMCNNVGIQLHTQPNSRRHSDQSILCRCFNFSCTYDKLWQMSQHVQDLDVLHEPYLLVSVWADHKSGGQLGHSLQPH